MNRIEAKLEMLKKKGEKAFITYMTAGLPDMEGTKRIIRAQEEAGTDIIELGVPFSDPIADGPVIQDASYRSILKGTNLKKIFRAVAELRQEGCQTPLIFMMYYNTISYYGLDAFAETCAKVGVDGLIVPDLPKEEQGPLSAALEKVEGSPIMIQLVSPLSKQRVPMILEGARGFVYCVSSMGVTGQAAQFHKDIVEYLTAVKKEAGIPVMMGFGIREAADVKPMREIIDGAIVGSHFIKLMDGCGYDTGKIQEYIRKFKREFNENG